jgi:hypothetical protein
VSTAARIGIYVHHHGGGHAARAGAIGRSLAERGAAVTYLSSLPGDRIGAGEAVLLPLDTDLGTEAGADRDPAAAPGATLADDLLPTPAELHFAPLGSAGLAGRMAAIAGWIGDARPDLMLVDVSVEVAMLARLCGVPFAYLRQTGVRDDPPHQLAYRWAAGLLAPWPEWLERAGTPGPVRAKTAYAGAITRFDGMDRPGDARGRPRRAIVLGECGAMTEEIAAAAPDWQVLGPRPVDLDGLVSCAVVVAPGGANIVAEAAFARCGLVCVPQPRPFDEQLARAEDLERHGAAVVLDTAEGKANPVGDGAAGSGSPADERARRDWSRLLEEARTRQPELARWADGAGAGRAADYLLALARGSSVPASSSQSTRPSLASSASQPLAGHSPQSPR